MICLDEMTVLKGEFKKLQFLPPLFWEKLSNLDMAAGKGHVEILEYLLQHGGGSLIDSKNHDEVRK